jgi:hypothetical protein
MKTREEKLAYDRAYRAKNRAKVNGHAAKHRAANRPALNARLRAWSKANPDKVRQYARKWAGLPPATRLAPACCECCGGKETGRVLALDHCHLTKTFRGWLCAECNTAIGKLGDEIIGVLKALNYLLRASGFEQVSIDDFKHTGRISNER